MIIRTIIVMAIAFSILLAIYLIGKSHGEYGKRKMRSELASYKKFIATLREEAWLNREVDPSMMIICQMIADFEKEKRVIDK